MRAAVIIPVYNHEAGVGEVIKAARRLGLPIFVVDDGSTDTTPAVLATHEGITVLRHPVNRGKGAGPLPIRISEAPRTDRAHEGDLVPGPAANRRPTRHGSPERELPRLSASVSSPRASPAARRPPSSPC